MFWQQQQPIFMRILTTWSKKLTCTIEWKHAHSMVKMQPLMTVNISKLTHLNSGGYRHLQNPSHNPSPNCWLGGPILYFNFWQERGQITANHQWNLVPAKNSNIVWDPLIKIITANKPICCNWKARDFASVRPTSVVKVPCLKCSTSDKNVTFQGGLVLLFMPLLVTWFLLYLSFGDSGTV